MSGKKAEQIEEIPLRRSSRTIKAPKTIYDEASLEMEKKRFSPKKKKSPIGAKKEELQDFDELEDFDNLSDEQPKKKTQEKQ